MARSFSPFRTHRRADKNIALSLSLSLFSIQFHAFKSWTVSTTSQNTSARCIFTSAPSWKRLWLKYNAFAHWLKRYSCDLRQSIAIRAMLCPNIHQGLDLSHTKHCIFYHHFLTKWEFRCSNEIMLLPLISRHTRLTINPATLIDNSLTDNRIHTVTPSVGVQYLK